MAHNNDPAGQVAHRLAAAIIRRLAGMQHDLDRSMRGLARDLRSLGHQALVPASVAALTEHVERVDGVRFGELVAALEPDAAAVQSALDRIIQTARDQPAEQAFDVAGHLERWRPIVDAVVAAAHSGQPMPEDLGQALDRLGRTEDWGALVGVLRRIMAGERDAAALLSGLDPVDTAIVTTVLEQLGEGINVEENPRETTENPPR